MRQFDDSRSPPDRRTVRAALAEARRIARGVPNVVGIGVGWKHSARRSRGGFGVTRTRCVKFFVVEKESRPRYRLPRRFTFLSAGRRYSARTDVVAAGEPALHGSVPRATFGNGNLTARFSPGFLLTNPDADEFFLVTAGHALLWKNPKDSDDVHRRSADPCDFEIEGATGSIGCAEFDWSFPLVGTPPRRLDVGVVRLGRPGVRVFNREPWVSLTSIATASELGKLDAASPNARCSVFGIRHDDPVTAELETVELLGIGVLDESYAPDLITTRSLTEDYAVGDSGGLVVDSTLTKVLGIHIIGLNPGPKPDLESEIGVALAGHTILAHAQREAGVALRLPTRAELAGA